MEKKTNEELRVIGREMFMNMKELVTATEYIEVLKNGLLSVILSFDITKNKKKQMFDELLEHMKEVFDDILEEVEGK
jgi:hypothetical protein